MNLQPYTRSEYRPSMGAFTPQSAASIASSGAAVTVGILGALNALAIGGSAAGPIGAAVAAAAALAVAIYKVFQGCGATCTMTSNDANQIEPLLLQNLQNYLAAPVHYASLQAAALNNFQTTWNSLVAACSNPSFGQAGVNCIGDRQQGACHYKTATPGAWQNGAWVPPGPQVSSGGSCWNWWIGYHDPIANDPTVVPDPATGTSGAASSASPDLVPVFLIAAVMLGALLL